VVNFELYIREMYEYWPDTANSRTLCTDVV